MDALMNILKKATKEELIEELHQTLNTPFGGMQKGSVCEKLRIKRVQRLLNNYKKSYSYNSYKIYREEMIKLIQDGVIDFDISDIGDYDDSE